MYLIGYLKMRWIDQEVYCWFGGEDVLVSVRCFRVKISLASKGFGGLIEFK